jgi:hypothetical protein
MLRTKEVLDRGGSISIKAFDPERASVESGSGGWGAFTPRKKQGKIRSMLSAKRNTCTDKQADRVRTWRKRHCQAGWET